MVAFEDSRDPHEVIADALSIEPDEEAVAILYLALRRGAVLDRCYTLWGEHGVHGTDPHQCWLPVGHPGRHQCRSWGCRSWRKRGFAG